ncbi:MAG: sialate O-acetylesterase [Phycisphaerae bacterium]
MRLTTRWTAVALAVFCFGLSAWAEAPTPKDKFHLYLLVGQSNMAGRGKVEEQDKTPDPRIVSLNKAGQWVPAVEPLHFDKTAAGVGPGFAFARAMIEAEKDPAVKIGLIPCAVGGSPIASWNAGVQDPGTKAFAWDDTVKRLKLAQEAGTLKGILWHQGESDSSEKLAPSYGGKLEKVLGGLKDVAGTPDVPIVVGHLFAFKENKWKDVINQALSNLPKRLQNVGVVASEGMKDKGDNTHLDSPSAREFGRRYAKEMLRVQGQVKPIKLNLWEHGVPPVEGAMAKAVGAEERKIARVRNVSEPAVSVYLPNDGKAARTAVVVCPGGGYGALAIEKEGDCVARWLNELGIVGVVLKYRLNQYPQPAALQDAQRAIRLVRERSTEWGVDPAKVGVMGFSAGGHLAAYASTAEPMPVPGPANGSWKAIDSRPAFSVLVYGVLPVSADDKMAGGMYVPLAVGPRTPPAFCVHAKDDKIPFTFSENYAAKVKAAGGRAEVHVYEAGGHGFGMGVDGGEVAGWPAACAKWLEANGWK